MRGQRCAQAVDCEEKRTSIHLVRGITPNGKERSERASSSPASLDDFSDRLISLDILVR